MLPIRNISYLLPMCCSFWEKCINSQKTGLGCSTPLTLQIQCLTLLYYHLFFLCKRSVYQNFCVWCWENKTKQNTNMVQNSVLLKGVGTQIYNMHTFVTRGFQNITLICSQILPLNKLLSERYPTQDWIWSEKVKNDSVSWQQVLFKHSCDLHPF